MPQEYGRSQVRRRARGVIPDDLGDGVRLVEQLRRRGVLKQVDTWLPLSRKAGFVAAPLVVAFLLFLASGKRGLRPTLSGWSQSLRRLLSAAAGVHTLPSSSAFSRALSDFTFEQVRPFTAAVLGASVPLPLLQHPSVAQRDSHGMNWHVLDVDPTVKAFRVRELLDDDEHFPPQRVAPGGPGYVGRKRGEHRVRAVPVLHDGSALWLAMETMGAEGSVAPVFRSVLSKALVITDQAGIQRKAVVVRADGEFGSVDAMCASLDLGVTMVTRISRYGLLSRETVIAAMREATWHVVRSKSTTARKKAADIGLFTLRSSTDSGATIRVRVIAVVTPTSKTVDDPHEGRGVVHDGMRIELFATTLPAEDWSAADVIELYQGRSGIENRLAQEDREFGLGRTFSYNLAGQEWAWGVGLALWNWRIAAGFEERKVGTERPRQMVRAPGTRWDPPVVTGPEPTMEDDTSSEASGIAVAPAGASPRTAPLEVESSPSTSGSAPAEPPLTEDLEPPTRARPPTLRFHMQRVAGENWTGWFSTFMRRTFATALAEDGWTFDDARLTLRCPNNEHLFPYSVTKHERTAMLYVRTVSHACTGCRFREACFPRDRVGAYKQIGRTFPVADRPKIREIVAALRKTRARAPQRVPESRVRPSRRSVQRTGPAPDAPDAPLHEQVSVPRSGPYCTEGPTFQPAAARKAGRLKPSMTVWVSAPYVPLNVYKRTPLLAENCGSRSKNRRTREEIQDRHSKAPSGRTKTTKSTKAVTRTRR